MGNPRHMTQIGLPRGNRRIFFEDYVVSYMKQHKSETTTKVALFGHTRKEEDTTKFFIFGAVRLPEEKAEEECERIRMLYFSDYQYLGYGELGTDLPDGFYIETEHGTSYIEGYYCFYDDNDAMLNFMVEERENDKNVVVLEKLHRDNHRELPPKIEAGSTERISAREYRRAFSGKERQPVNKLKLSVVITFMIMCAVSVRDYLSERFVDEDNNSAQVVTESNLVDALEQENVVGGEVSETEEIKMTDVSANKEAPEREPVIFEEETEAVEAMSLSAEAIVAEESVEQYHLVQKGDNLINISIQYYGNANQVNAICEANNISHPDEIKTGQKLLLP